MVGAGFLMLFLAAFSLYRLFLAQGGEMGVPHPGFLLPLAISLPYLANTTGWLLTELGGSLGDLWPAKDC